MSAPIRVVVCDDSRTYAQALKRVLEADGDMQVVRVYGSAEQLLAGLATLRPDLVTMDLELPGMSGVEATRRIMATQPVPVVVVSAHTGAGSLHAAEALAAGAVDVLHKDDLRVPAGETAVAKALRRRMRRLSRVRVGALPGTAAPGSAPPDRRAPTPRCARRVRVIGIAASTGGPSALRVVLGALPADLPVPVLVVQHMTEGFTGGLARWLDAAVPPPVRLAADCVQATPGVWLAPDGAHLVIGPDLRMRLDRRTPPDPHRPSGDVLFRSLAACAGPGAAVAVLTGMGADGAKGVAAVVAAGGLAIAQDKGSAAVIGMPRAAADAGAQRVLALERIGSALAALAVGSRAG